MTIFCEKQTRGDSFPNSAGAIQTLLLPSLQANFFLQGSRKITKFAPSNLYNAIMNVTRKATTVRLPDYLLADLHAEARRRNISMSKLLECIAEETMYRPNAETLAAIEEARSGVEMEDFDPDELD